VSVDIAVIGAGIVGCSAAAFLAEAGASVVVVDRRGLAAGASGRNSGSLQHPLDPLLSELHEETLRLHREVLELPAEPDGVLLLGATSANGFPVPAQVVEDASALEPVLRPGTPAVRLETGWAIGPRAATTAWAKRATDAGARFTHDEPSRSDLVLRATGAWTDGVTPLWGVTARTRLSARHVLEEAGVEDIVAGASGAIFSLVGGVLGSSFDAGEPDPQRRMEDMIERAERFLGRVDAEEPRACPRPQTADGLPLAGRLDERTWVCAGHGSWGISTGPATARLVAAAMIGRAEIPPAYDPARFRRDGEGQPDAS
jgi:glycine/D-amino acid oxidase-like deaminating enzyme